VGFVALDGGAADGLATDTGIVPEDVEARFLGEKGRNAGWDSGEVVEVKVKTFELTRACCISGFYCLDCSGDFGGRAASYVDSSTF
jgi:hypothetical protein